MMPKFSNEEEAKSVALRLFIHLVGDIHQPLHCATLVNPDFPHGDAGGNAFPLKYHYSVDNLHALFDSVMYKYHDSIKLVRIEIYNLYSHLTKRLGIKLETCQIL